MVRLVLSLALACCLSGIPVAAAEGCARVGEGMVHGCCMRPHTDGGDAVIGFCGCKLAPRPTNAARSRISTPASERTDRSTVHQAASSEGHLPHSSSVHNLTMSSDAAGPPGTAPPRLSATGFRC